MKSNYPALYRYKYFKQIFCFLSNKKREPVSTSSLRVIYIKPPVILYYENEKTQALQIRFQHFLFIIINLFIASFPSRHSQ
jgi:hypothetical protein